MHDLRLHSRSRLTSNRMWNFLQVVKPGIVIGNLVAAMGGYAIGSGVAPFSITVFAGLSLGTLLVIAASCVVNNYIDRDVDVYMTRTARRPSVTGALPLKTAAWYAAVMYGVGLALLWWLTNPLTLAVGVGGALLYTLAYGYAKRHTHFSTLIGAVPGATPPLAGYLAATGRFDLGALLLFGIMFAWQVPHFYAIAVFRFEEYKAAGLPMLPIVKGLSRTVWEMRVFGVVFVLLCVLLAHSGYAGFMFGLAAVLLGLYWLAAMFTPDWRVRTHESARRVFRRSLVVLLLTSVFMILNPLLL